MSNIPSDVVKFLHSCLMQLFTIFIGITYRSITSWCEIILCVAQEWIEIFQFVEYNPFFYHVSHVRLEIMVEDVIDGVIPYLAL